MENWRELFDEVYHQPPPATNEEVAALLGALAQPLSDAELEETVRSQRNPFSPGDDLFSRWAPFDPRSWSFFSVALPGAYESLLRWSNGPSVRTGSREFGFFGSLELREYLLAYNFPEYMPGAIPIGLDGGGVFAAFDTRGGLQNDEYPILATAAGNLGFEDATLISVAFKSFCTGRTAIGSLGT